MPLFPQGLKLDFTKQLLSMYLQKKMREQEEERMAGLAEQYMKESTPTYIPSNVGKYPVPIPQTIGGTPSPKIIGQTAAAGILPSLSAYQKSLKPNLKVMNTPQGTYQYDEDNPAPTWQEIQKNEKPPTSGSYTWTVATDEKGNEITKKFGNETKIKYIEVDRETQKPTGSFKYESGGSQQRQPVPETVLSGIIREYNKSTEKAQGMVEFSDMVYDLANSSSPIAQGTIPTVMARASGEVGNLSEADKAPFGGSQAILDRLAQFLQRSAEGTLTEDNKRFVKELADIFKQSGKRRMTDRARRISKQYSKAYKNSYDINEQSIYEALNPDMGETQSTGKKIIKLKDGTEIEVE